MLKGHLYTYNLLGCCHQALNRNEHVNNDNEELKLQGGHALRDDRKRLSL